MPSHRWQRSGYARIGIHRLEPAARPPDDILVPLGEAEARILECPACGLVLAHWSVPEPPTMRRVYAYGMELDALAVHPGRIPRCTPRHPADIEGDPTP